MITYEELRDELKTFTIPQLFDLLPNKEKAKYPDEELDNEGKYNLIEVILEKDYYTPSL
jgi:hypothetical protein